MKALNINTGANSVSFADERQRSPYEVPAGAFASITIEGVDSSWGEFLMREDALAVLGWLTALFASEGGETAHETAHEPTERGR